MITYETQSNLLKAISHPTRLAILDLLGKGEQCVCHMEATLSLRQAYISQQLMILKDAGLIEARRDGLNLYYRVTKPELLDVLTALTAVTGSVTKRPPHKHANIDCPCPKCNTKTSKRLIQVAAA